MQAWLKALGKNLLRAFIAYLAFLFISGILSTLFVLAGSEIIKEFNLDMRYVFLAGSLPIPFAAYSVLRAFELYDKEAQTAFMPRSEEGYSLKAALRKLFSLPVLSGKLWSCALLWLSLILILPYSFGFRSVVGSFYPALDMSAPQAKAVMAGVVAPVMLIVIFLAKTSAHKWWVIAGTTERERILNHPHPNVRLGLETVKIFLIYSLAFLALPTVIMVAVSFALTVAIFKDSRLWISLGVILALYLVIKYSSILIRRRKYYRRLLRTLRGAGYEISAVRYPVISALIPKSGATMHLFDGERHWDVKLMSAKHPRRPTYLFESGVATTKKTVSILKMDLFHVMTDEQFGFSSECGKIVIYCPGSKKLYANYGRCDTLPDDGEGGFTSIAMSRRGGGESGAAGARYRGPGYVSDLERGIIKPLSSGDKIGEYKFFTPDGFLSAAENRVLHR